MNNNDTKGITDKYISRQEYLKKYVSNGVIGLCVSSNRGRTPLQFPPPFALTGPLHVYLQSLGFMHTNFKEHTKTT